MAGNNVVEEMSERRILKNIVILSVVFMLNFLACGRIIIVTGKCSD